MTLPKEAPLSAPTLWWGSSPGSLIQYVSNTENDAISATDQTNIRTTKRKEENRTTTARKLLAVLDYSNKYYS